MNRNARLAWMAALLAVVAPLAAGAQAPRMSPPPMMMMSAGGRVDFTSLDDARMRAEKGPTVLLFAAAWCPTCQAILRDIASHQADLGGVTVVVVDYDKSTDLKRMYGVTYQHSFVQIDAGGSKVAAWSGGGVQEILRRVAGGM